MKYTEQQILEAVKLIQDICHETECEKCPFETADGECGITENVPEEWVINTPERFRALI